MRTSLNKVSKDVRVRRKKDRQKGGGQMEKKETIILASCSFVGKDIEELIH